MNFSNMSPSHRLQSSMNCPSVGPFHRVQSFRNRLLQHGSPTGSQVLPANLLWRGLLSSQGHRSWQDPAPVWASHGVTGSFGCIHLPRRGVLTGLQVDICSTMDLHGLQGHCLPHHGLLHGLQGNLCFGAWSTSFPSFTDLGVCRVASLAYSHYSLALQFFFLIQYVIPEVLPPLLLGSVLASGRSVPELAGIGSIGHRRSFQQLLTESYNHRINKVGKDL